MRHIRLTSVLARILCLPVGCLLLAGCDYRMVPPAAWSPDSQTVAHIRIQGRKCYLDWMKVDKPGKKFSALLRADESGPLFTWRRGLGLLAFSPDSRHVAATTHNGVQVVHLASRRTWLVDTPPGRALVQVIWMSNQEIAYTTRQDIHWRRRRHAVGWRKIWRKNINRVSETRKLIYEDGGGPGLPDSLQPSFSPGGRYAICTSKGLKGKLKLLDLRSGKVRIFGRRGSDGDPSAYSEIKVSWKPDDSAAFCLVSDSDKDAWNNAALIETGTGKVVDLTDKFNATLGPYSTQVSLLNLSLSSRWTPDGQFVLVNSSKRGTLAWLIRPEPWKLLPIGRLFAKQMAPTRNFQAGVGMLPVAGWLWSVDPSGHTAYVMDYAEKEIIKAPSHRPGRRGQTVPDLTARFDTTGQLGVSPDGKWQALSDGNRFQIRRFMQLPRR